MAVTIINEEGGGLGTKILDDDGNDLCDMLSVESIEVKISADKVNRAKIVVGLIKAKIKGLTKWVVKDPISGDFQAVSHIMFENGNRICFREDGEITLHDNQGIVRFSDLSSK